MRLGPRRRGGRSATIFVLGLLANVTVLVLYHSPSRHSLPIVRIASIVSFACLYWANVTGRTRVHPKQHFTVLDLH